jgi:hypothetical protein
MPKFSDIPKMTKTPCYHVNISLDDMIDTFERYTKEYGLDLNPDFQRPHVWTEEKQIAYVEFVLRGGQSSKTILLNMPNWMHWKQDVFETGGKNCMVIVDGKQRLEAVRRFLNNEIPVFGYTLNQYEDKFRLNLISFDIYINNLNSRKEVLKWYLDLNTGGVVHSDEEIEKVKILLEKEIA